MFGEVYVWQIAKLKVTGEIKFGEWIDFGHKDTIDKLKFGCLKFGKSLATRQTFPLYGTCAYVGYSVFICNLYYR